MIFNTPTKFNIFIGIDQTGAINHHKQPKALATAIIYRHKKKWQLINHLLLENLDFLNINKLLSEILPLNFSKKNKCFILVDTVFGLPKNLKKNMTTIFNQAKYYRMNDQEYGSKVAFCFFKNFLPSTDSLLPKREVEILCKANSVFALKPFQKNIGCGSYRIIKNLSQDLSWFDLWPFVEKSKKRFMIAEGYPSLYWKILLNSPTRRLEVLNKYLENNFSYYQKTNDTNDADAIILALAAKHFNNQNFLSTKFDANIKNYEGWIFGVSPP